MKAGIRVATYNIRKCIGLDRRRNPERILEVLREMDADVIALQEADFRFGQRESSLPFRKIDEETPWKHVPWPLTGQRRQNGIGWHGNAILVRDEYDIREGRPLDLPMLEPRGAVACEIETTDGPLRVIGAHLDLSGLWRRRQVRAILDYLDGVPHQIPTVIMGDFNQWSDRGALSEFAFHHYRILQTPKSFHSARPVARLDRVVICRHIDAQQVGYHDSKLSRKASDHLPIWADIEIA